MEATYYTISQSVNTVKSEIKRITNDNIIFSNRLIYGKLKKYRNLLLKRESDKSKLRNSNAIQTLTCLNLEETDMIECCDGVNSGYSVLRSKYKIPKFLDSVLDRRYIRVYDMLRTTVFDEKSPEVVIQQQKMRFKYPSISFWIRNNYIYFDNSNKRIKNPEKIIIDGIFESPEDVFTFNTCEQNDCCAEEDKVCTFIPMLQREFNCPGHLQAVVEQLTIEELIKTVSSTPQDRENDSKEKNIA